MLPNESLSGVGENHQKLEKHGKMEVKLMMMMMSDRCITIKLLIKLVLLNQSVDFDSVFHGNLQCWFGPIQL